MAYSLKQFEIMFDGTFLKNEQCFCALMTVLLCSSFTVKVFSLPEKLVIVVIICKINCLENNVQLLGEHVGFYIQVLMTVFGEGEYIADSGLLFLLIQVQVSSRSQR